MDLERRDVEPSREAAGIREQIREAGRQLIAQHDIKAVGIGFGGPVDPVDGTVTRSFQIDGWDGFRIVAWSEKELKRSTFLGNDSDMAGLGEARFGAGKGHHVVLYSNVGSGIGGALVIGGQLYLGGSGGASEIGHMRPGVHADSPEETVESLASGWGMTKVAQQRLQHAQPEDGEAITGLLERCSGDAYNLNGKILADAMAEGNAIATDTFLQGIQTYGWALAQAITLLGPNIVVIGGGVPLIGEELYLAPLRKAIERYVIQPRLGTYVVKPASLGEQVVLHGALALAATADHEAPISCQ